jgi:DNA-binding NarL/FixJ family response regulator
MTLRILVVDDQPIARAGIATMLDAEDDIVVVGQSGDGEAAVRDALATSPDVVVMDIRMPRLDGISATRLITASLDCAVVLITTFDDDDHLFDGIAAGASGFLLKTSGGDLIAAAVRSAARGDSLIDPAMTRALIDQAVTPRSATRPDAVQQAALASLSDWEKDMLDAVARGLSNLDIARELFLSPATVKTHISALLSKTGSSTRVQAAVFAFQTGFAQPGATPNVIAHRN